MGYDCKILLDSINTAEPEGNSLMNHIVHEAFLLTSAGYRQFAEHVQETGDVLAEFANWLCTNWLLNGPLDLAMHRLKYWSADQFNLEFVTFKTNLIPEQDLSALKPS